MASRIGADHLFRHHLHFSSVVHPRRESRRHHLRSHSAPLLRLLGSESIIYSVIISTSPASASFILGESASSFLPSLSSVSAASRIGVDHFFLHHLHFSSVGVVHPRRVGVIISAVTQIRCCGNQRNPPPSAVKVLKEMLLRFTLAAKESDYFVVSKQLELEISLTLAAKESTMEVLCVCGQWRSKDTFQWEFHVDLNRNASFISIEEDLQFEDLMKIVSKDFKEEVIGLSYGMSLDIKSTVECFPPISVANTRHLRSFIGKSRSFDGTCRLCVKVNPDSASCNNQASDTFASPVSNVQREIQVHTDPTSCNRQTSDTFASHVPLNAIPVFCSTVQREKQCLLYEGVSTVPLNSLPDFSPVHIGLSPATRGAETWAKAYAESIHPGGELSTSTYPANIDELSCPPPTTKKISGRPPTKRKRSVGEFGVPGSKSQSHKCSRCGIGGHNRITCKRPIG
ncbi:hypothetical protein YC2023_083837 [Brassica napus]